MAAAADQQHSALLSNLVPLNALSEEHLGQLLSRIQVENLRSGDYLFKAGDVDHQHVYLLNGRVELISDDKVVDAIRSGSNTARFALAHQWPRKFSARARGKVSIVRIDSRMISEMLVSTQTQSYRVSEVSNDSEGDWMSQVLRSRLFQQIPASSIQNVLRRMESVHARKGQHVIREGEPGTHYYVVVKGECIVTRSLGGKFRELARLGPGDGFGEEALVSELPRNASVVMRTDGVLVRVTKEDFSELISRPLLIRLSYEQALGREKDGAVWLDIRSPADYATEHVRKALNLPLNVLRKETSALDGEAEYLVYGSESGDGMVGAFLLRERGFDAKALQGGVAAVAQERLIRAREELETPEQESAAATVPMPNDSGVQSREVEREPTARVAEAETTRIAAAEVESPRPGDGAKESNTGLAEELARLKRENDALKGGLETRQREYDEVVAERERLREETQTLQGELDELQEVLQEASAEESSHQWALIRAQEAVDRLKGDLNEERNRNRILREELEEMERRMDDMRAKLEGES